MQTFSERFIQPLQNEISTAARYINQCNLSHSFCRWKASADGFESNIDFTNELNYHLAQSFYTHTLKNLLKKSKCGKQACPPRMIYVTCATQCLPLVVVRPFNMPTQVHRSIFQTKARRRKTNTSHCYCSLVVQ